MLGIKESKHSWHIKLRFLNAGYTQLTKGAFCIWCKLREMVETTTAVLDSLFQKNTISLAGQTYKDGNKNMSYHVQQNTQQRSLGIFIVIAFHVLLIWGLASGLGVTIRKLISPDAIKIAPTPPPQTTPPPPIELPIPVIPKTNILTVDPTQLPVIAIETAEPPRVISTTGGDIVTTAGPTISKPTLKNATKPIYPLAASRLGEAGTTGLELYITPDGRVSDVQVFSTSGSSRLDEAAVKHAKRNWTFSACTENGKAVGCWYKTKLVWRLEDATH